MQISSFQFEIGESRKIKIDIKRKANTFGLANWVNNQTDRVGFQCANSNCFTADSLNYFFITFTVIIKFIARIFCI